MSICSSDRFRSASSKMPPDAPGQFGFDIGQRDAARAAHDQQVIDHIRRFRRQAGGIAAHGLDHGFHGLFAEFLGAFFGPRASRRAVQLLSGSAPTRASMAAARVSSALIPVAPRSRLRPYGPLPARW
jgi:hypothetical protein